MYDQCSVWKCYATLHYTLTSLRGLRILWGYGTSPAWGAPTLFVGLPTFYSYIINPRYAWREHRRKEANYHVLKQDIRYKWALCTWFAPCWPWRLHFLFLCRRYLHVTGQDSDSFQTIWLIITFCSLLSQAFVGLLFLSFTFREDLHVPRTKINKAISHEHTLHRRS